tara:strand:+ start:2766 stop:3041 length:276 start_codon:yes stop_codon:yes gene_type:complete
MTHVLRAHGLFDTAIEAVLRFQVRLVDDPHLPERLDVLCNKLDRERCLGTADRELLIDCVTARKAALNVWRPTPLAQRVMDECDKIIELTA